VNDHRSWTTRLLDRLVPGSPARDGVRPPPVRQRAFWAVQGLILAIAVVHTLLERNGFPAALYLVPSSLFLIPVVYAALKFGVRGAIPTAIWSAALTVPDLVLSHEGLDRLGVLWQSAILLVVGAFVGLAVDHERDAREEAEAREAARLASERRYRALYDSAADAVLVIDAQGRIEEANVAATRLLDRDLGALRGRGLSQVVGADLAADVLGDPTESPPRPMLRRDGEPPVWVQPVGASPLAGVGGAGGSQVILRDVTLEYEREQGLEGYARHAIAAREEERRRMARELHDGPLQSLVLLARTLDALDEDEGEGGALDDAREIIDETAGELRRLSRALRPPILDDLGLVPALRSETSALAHRSGMEAHFELIGEVRPLPQDTELLLLRVTQESLHNAERHSGASCVNVTLRYEADVAKLVVADDGRGIGTIPRPTTLLARGKLGLLGIQERVRLAHGALDIGPRQGGGTEVRVRVPASPA
jgi:PAS domain S-box-containing protein